MGLPIRGILKAAKKATKVAAQVAGVVGTKVDGTPVTGRKKRLAASLVALVVAAGWLDADVAEALSEVVLNLLAFVQ